MVKFKATFPHEIVGEFMKNFNVVFIVIMMLVMAFTASVFPQIKGNLHRNQKFIQEKMRELNRGQELQISGSNDDELFTNEQKLSLPKERDKKTTKLSKILSDTMYVQTSALKQDWDTLSNEWMDGHGITYIYDANGNLTEKCIDYFSFYEPNRKWTYTYDINRNLTEEIYWHSKTDGWSEYSRISYIYNEHGDKTEILHQSWNGTVWVNHWLDTCRYDGNGNIRELLHKSWKGSSWYIANKYSYTYNTDGNLTEVLFQHSGDSIWVNDLKLAYAYNANGKPTEFLTQDWNDTTWINTIKYSYTYNESGNKIEALYQWWHSDSGWISHSKYTSAYDAHDNLTEHLCYYWSRGMWNNETNEIYTYDTDGNKTEYLSQRWNIDKWLNYEREIYTWQVLITDINELSNTINSYSLSPNYPNPFNPQTKIFFSVPKESFITLKIYDLLGREVATLVQDKKQVGEYTVTWNADNVPSSVYFYKLVAGDFIQTKKMILMK
jgi:hypothetical protein